MGQLLKFFLSGCLALAVASFVPDSELLPAAARRAQFIMLLAAALWVTEAVPAFAVGILVMVMVGHSHRLVGWLN